MVGASIERAWENVRDWEHLPWLHATSFADIELIEERPDGWHARVKTHPADSGPWLEIEVTAGDELGEPLSIDLNSTTGAEVVGSATATPGSGPVGTEHALRVEVLEAWEDQVTRVAVSADSGSRGTELFELRQDSADYGLWVLDLRSSGEEGEARQDIWTIQLFQEQVVQEPLDTAVAN